MMRRALAGLGLCCALFALPTSASATPATDALAAAGITVSWPTAVGTTTLSPGARLTVRVAKSAARGKAPVVVRVDRLRADGTRAKLLRRVTLRSGRTSYTLPGGAGRRYAVVVRTASASLRTVIRAESAATSGTSHLNETTTAPAGASGSASLGIGDATTTSPAQPGGPANPLGDCVAGATPSFTVAGSTGGPVHPGDAFPYTLTNTGSACLTGGLGWTLDRLVDGAWVPVPVLFPIPAVAFTIKPGGTFAAGAIRIPFDAVPGHYRWTVTFSGVPGSGEVDVAAPTP